MSKQSEEEITLVVHIKRKLHLDLKIYCARNRTTIQDVVSSLIEAKIK